MPLWTRTARMKRGSSVRGAVALMWAACVACSTGCGGGSRPDPETRINLVDVPRLATALHRFKADCGRFPNAVEGLNALLKKPGGGDIGDKWKGPYVKDEDDLEDPWKQVYQYSYSVKDGQEQVRVWSLGKDGKPNTADDFPQKIDRRPKKGRGVP